MSNSALYIITVLIWGSTWLAIEFQLGTVAPEVSVLYRYLLAAGLLFAWSFVRRLPLRFDFRTHLRFALLGLLMFCLNYILAYHAQRFVASALIAVAFSMILWLNIINSRIFFGVRSNGRVLFGALLGLLGISAMFWPSIVTISLSDATVIGALLGMAGAYAASLGNMISQGSQRHGIPIIQSNAWGMAYGALFTLLIVIRLDRPLTFDWSPDYVVSLLYLAIFGSIVAFGAYLQLLGRIGAHKAGYATVLFPVVALVLSALFEDFQLNGLILSGMALALTGNYFVMKPSRSKQNMSPNVLSQRSVARN